VQGERAIATPILRDAARKAMSYSGLRDQRLSDRAVSEVTAGAKLRIEFWVALVLEMTLAPASIPWSRCGVSGDSGVRDRQFPIRPGQQPQSVGADRNADWEAHEVDCGSKQADRPRPTRSMQKTDSCHKGRNRQQQDQQSDPDRNCGHEQHVLRPFGRQPAADH
jgi:hypothetical protein